ncbi:phage major capsid protein [Eremococcus coleocola]|uniref:phage major capsid protein n=1 Tax=Eremococcus coleocola TaxID=88132 RepID=UPI000412832F|nr:phage major capsid protein [Eremococcus coleocola]
MNKLNELRQKRAKAWDQTKAFLDECHKNSDVLSIEDVQTYDRMENEVVALGKEIERLEKQEEMDRMMNQATSQGIVQNPQAQPTTKTGKASPEYSEAFWNVMRGKQPSTFTNALQVGTDTEGGYLVPDEFERILIEGLESENIFRQISKVIQTNSGERKIPVVASKGDASWMDEEGAYVESDMSFNQVLLGAHKLGTLVKVSEELLNDSAFDLPSYIAREFSRRLGSKEEEAFLTGDGVGKPLGILKDTNLEVGATTAAAKSITFDELIDLYYSLKEPYRKSAVFIMNDQTVKAVRQLKDNSGQYIWQPSLVADTPDQILNCPVLTSPYMPEMAGGASTVLFGDFSYFWIADREGRSFKRLNELYATNGQVGFLGSQRVDGKLVLPEAFKVLKQKGTTA